MINNEPIDTANQQLIDQGKAGLVVIVDTLDRIDNKPRGHQRLAQVGKIFDSLATLDRLCLASGGHVRNLLVLVNDCLKKADPPFTQALLDQVISLRRSRPGQSH